MHPVSVHGLTARAPHRQGSREIDPDRETDRGDLAGAVYLVLRSAGCRCASDGLYEVMAAHLLEPAVVGAVSADEDRVDRGLRVHCPRTNGGQFPLS